MHEQVVVAAPRQARHHPPRRLLGAAASAAAVRRRLLHLPTILAAAAVNGCRGRAGTACPSVGRRRGLAALPLGCAPAAAGAAPAAAHQRLRPLDCAAGGRPRVCEHHHCGMGGRGRGRGQGKGRQLVGSIRVRIIKLARSCMAVVCMQPKSPQGPAQARSCPPVLPLLAPPPTRAPWLLGQARRMSPCPCSARRRTYAHPPATSSTLQAWMDRQGCCWSAAQLPPCCPPLIPSS